MRVTGRGRGFEFQNKNLKTPNTRFTRTREQKILEGGQHKKKRSAQLMLAGRGINVSRRP